MPRSFTKPKKICNVSVSSDATSSYDRQLLPYDACNAWNNDDDSINPVSTFKLKRIHEDVPNLGQEIDRLADDLFASFHESF